MVVEQILILHDHGLETSMRGKGIKNSTREEFYNICSRENHKPSSNWGKYNWDSSAQYNTFDDSIMVRSYQEIVNSLCKPEEEVACCCSEGWCNLCSLMKIIYQATFSNNDRKNTILLIAVPDYLNEAVISEIHSSFGNKFKDLIILKESLALALIARSELEETKGFRTDIVTVVKRHHQCFFSKFHIVNNQLYKDNFFSLPFQGKLEIDEVSGPLKTFLLPFHNDNEDHKVQIDIANGIDASNISNQLHKQESYKGFVNKSKDAEAIYFHQKEIKEINGIDQDMLKYMITAMEGPIDVETYYILSDNFPAEAKFTYLESSEARDILEGCYYCLEILERKEIICKYGEINFQASINNTEFESIATLGSQSSRTNIEADLGSIVEIEDSEVTILLKAGHITKRYRHKFISPVEERSNIKSIVKFYPTSGNVSFQFKLLSLEGEKLQGERFQLLWSKGEVEKIFQSPPIVIDTGDETKRKKLSKKITNFSIPDIIRRPTKPLFQTSSKEDGYVHTFGNQRTLELDDNLTNLVSEVNSYAPNQAALEEGWETVAGFLFAFASVSSQKILMKSAIKKLSGLEDRHAFWAFGRTAQDPALLDFYIKAIVEKGIDNNENGLRLIWPFQKALSYHKEVSNISIFSYLHVARALTSFSEKLSKNGKFPWFGPSHHSKWVVAAILYLLQGRDYYPDFLPVNSFDCEALIDSVAALNVKMPNYAVDRDLNEGGLSLSSLVINFLKAEATEKQWEALKGKALN